MVDSVLKQAGETLSDVDGFVLTVGPGSFTGLRIGLSLIKGFILATEKPVLGISTLEAWAACAKPSNRPLFCLLDARKGEVYYSRFRWEGDRLIAEGDEGVASPETLAAKIQEPSHFLGTGLTRYGDFFKQRLNELYLEADTIEGLTPAGAAGLLAMDRFDRERIYDLNKLNLHYIRRPEAEQNMKPQDTVL
jgi:tRNA threonylcarbamoyladenosine biosynthesis protein TsaB